MLLEESCIYTFLLFITRVLHELNNLKFSRAVLKLLKNNVAESLIIL